MQPIGWMEYEGRERLELANCPSCGTTLCVAVSRLSSSARWRVTRLRTP